VPFFKTKRVASAACKLPMHAMSAIILIRVPDFITGAEASSVHSGDEDYSRAA
jgi:hypothetical protein